MRGNIRYNINKRKYWRERTINYPLVDISEARNTKERIMLVAVKMFSEHGYAAVSVRDIAKESGIKAASIYNHFASKEAIFDEIVETIKDVYMDFYDRLDRQITSVGSFEQALDCLFAELKEVYHMFIYYGINLIATEQFRNEKARRAFNDVYMKIGIEYSVKVFDRCIKNGWVRDFDTVTMATMFMNSIFVGSLVRIHEDMMNPTLYNPAEMFTKLQRFMLDSVDIIENPQ